MQRPSHQCTQPLPSPLATPIGKWKSGVGSPAFLLYVWGEGEEKVLFLGGGGGKGGALFFPLKKGWAGDQTKMEAAGHISYAHHFMSNIPKEKLSLSFSSTLSNLKEKVASSMVCNP